MMPTGSALPAASWREIGRKFYKDWVALLAVGLVDIIINVSLNPFDRYVLPAVLEEVKYPLYSNTVPDAAVPVIAVLVPFVVFGIVFVFTRDKRDLHQILLALFTGIVLTSFTTDALKFSTGRLRPNFFYRCFPDGKVLLRPDGNVNCTGDPSAVHEGHKSFPSGHSSWSFCGLGLVAFWLAGRLHMFDKRGHVLKVIPPLLPFVAAAAVAISRINDYAHHWSDVVVGGLLGTAYAYLAYRQHYPALHDPLAGVPYVSHAYLKPVSNNTEVPFRPQSDLESQASESGAYREHSADGVGA